MRRSVQVFAGVVPTVFVRQSVPHYERWRSVFDSTMAPVRERYGLTVTGIFRRVDDADMILLVLDVADLEQAREFAQSIVLDRGRAEALAGGRVQAEVWFSDDRMTVA
jgi:hypothetical protein